MKLIIEINMSKKLELYKVYDAFSTPLLSRLSDLSTKLYNTISSLEEIKPK